MTTRPDPRYSRQILLPGFGASGQARLRAARVLIVGLGGLGSPVALYLAAAGVGHLLLADCDAVDLSNLHRQILHRSGHIGMPKADSACLVLADLNPDPELIPIKPPLTADNLPRLLEGVDLVVDGCDNFATRFAVNAACVAARLPLVSGAVIRAEGQIAAFSGQPGAPCYQCLFPAEGLAEERCAVEGVLGPVAGIVGCVQATEALKILTGLGEPLFGRLLLLDAARLEWRSLRLAADPDCAICGGRA